MSLSLRASRLIPKRTVAIHVSWFGALILFCLAVIIPSAQYSSRMDQQIRDVRAQIEAQKNLRQIYDKLHTKGQKTTSRVLPLPERTAMPRGLASKVPATIGGIARHTALDTVSVSVDIHSVAARSPSLLVNTVLRGEFMNFRNFLIGLGELPYLERIEEIEVRQEPEFMEFRVKIRLALAT